MEMPFGWIAIHWQDGVLTGVDLEPEAPVVGTVDLPPALGEQIAAYLRDGLSPFDLPIELRGTPFQRRVWQALRAIPAGRTRTYGELAELLGTSARAVGGACRVNPCPIVVPCHRVVAKRGLGGFAGDTSGRKLAIKRWLLRHEGVELDGDKEPRMNANGPDCNSSGEASCPAKVLPASH
jgi:methylated-DNA-[protein]-cysteine S-methyltransferase